MPDITLVGLGLTVRSTIFSLSGVQLPTITSLYLYPFMLTDVGFIVRVLVVTPLYIPPFTKSVNVDPPLVLTCHLYIKFEPVAAPENTTCCPSQTV